ncbi:MAG: hypothetical protein AAF677_11385 [Pseudomonadota bacterium]
MDDRQAAGGDGAAGTDGSPAERQRVQAARDRALAAHRAGRLAEAQAAYDALLAERDDDADLCGLAGILALQQGRAADGERLLRRALAQPAPTPLALRNLNNLAAHLHTAGRTPEARDLLAGEIPIWPADTALDPVARRTVLSLTELLVQYGRAHAARRLLETAVPERVGDTAALALEGRIALETDDPARAAALLAEATVPGPDGAVVEQALVMRAVAEDRAGQREAAEATTAEVMRRWALLSRDAAPGQIGTVTFVCRAARRLANPAMIQRLQHYANGYPGQLQRELSHRFRFHSVLAEVHDTLALPRTDLVVNNICNPEWLGIPGNLAVAEAACAAAAGGAPIVNPPAVAAQTTRQRNAERLADIPGLRVPAIRRYRVDRAVAEGRIDALIDEIAATLGFPVILRHVALHDTVMRTMSGGEVPMRRVDDAKGLRAELTSGGWREMYAIEYVDVIRRDGTARKIRAIWVDGEIVVTMPGLNQGWLVAGGRSRPSGQRFYRSHPTAQQECVEIVNDPWGMLGDHVRAIVQTVFARLGLDIAGIDFDVRPDGEVVFFEANAAVLLLTHMSDAPDLRLPLHQRDRVIAAVDRLFAGLIQGTRPARAPDPAPGETVGGTTVTDPA